MTIRHSREPFRLNDVHDFGNPLIGDADGRDTEGLRESRLG